MPEAGIDLTRGWTHTVGNNLLGGSEVNVRYDFKGKNALVTGGATGIGRAACLAFAQAGAGVVVAGLGAAEGAAVVREIEEGGGKAIFVETDVRHERDIEAMMAAALSRFGRIDAAFNNAGIESSYGPLHELSTEEFDRIIAVNLRGIFLAMKHEIRHMLAAGGGTIVNTSSTAAITGMANIAAYTASKHGIIGLTKATALELGKSGIRVNAVAPGPVNTGLLARMVAGKVEIPAIAANNPMGRISEPEEIAQALLFLSSDAAGYITGHTLAIDGGFTVP